MRFPLITRLFPRMSWCMAFGQKNGRPNGTAVLTFPRRFHMIFICYDTRLRNVSKTDLNLKLTEEQVQK